MKVNCCSGSVVECSFVPSMASDGRVQMQLSRAQDVGTRLFCKRESWADDCVQHGRERRVN